MGVQTFLDTSILVSTFDPLNAGKRERALQRLEREYESGVPVISANVLSELYVALTKEKGRSAPIMKPDDAADAVRLYRALTVVPVDAEQVEHALFLRKEYRMGYWDALNLASAIASGCKLFVTEDSQSAAVIEGVRYEIST